jgi:hypothetical protein
MGMNKNRPFAVWAGGIFAAGILLTMACAAAFAQFESGRLEQFSPGFAPREQRYA